MTEEGILFHAKHAFMPNSLGYCGPDENAEMLSGLQSGKSGNGLVSTLEKFEAAYPFLKLIARSSGRSVFDYSVPEAYWIGNSLLRRVPHSEFYTFSHRELQRKDRERTRELFRRLDGSALPHHTFYVMSTYAASTATDGPSPGNERQRKLAELVDNCRISWGKVVRVRRRELDVISRPVKFEDGMLALGPQVRKVVGYNPDVRPFGLVKTGDTVSVHWNYACDLLTRRQERNIARYTESDLSLINRFLEVKSKGV